MASRKGFEPLTPGLGNLCSILLSYGDNDALLAQTCVRARVVLTWLWTIATVPLSGSATLIDDFHV